MPLGEAEYAMFGVERQLGRFRDWDEERIVFVLHNFEEGEDEVDEEDDECDSNEFSSVQMDSFT